jgi:hypothetical protein
VLAVLVAGSANDHGVAVQAVLMIMVLIVLAVLQSWQC